MSTFFRTAIWLIISLSLQSVAVAKGPVWKVSSNDEVLYLGGTIHVLSQSDYPLPPVFDAAYQNAATVVFETDIQKLQQPEFQQEMLPLLMFEKNTSLREVLNLETYEQLETYLLSHGIALDHLAQFKPGMLATTITMMELQRLGMVEAGVDQYYSSLALQDHKPQGMLETANSQIEKISAMGEGQENAFIQHTLLELESLPALMQGMKSAWREGDVETLEALALTPLSEEFPAIYQSLIVDRNNAWLNKFVTMLISEEVELVLVGAAHLVGEDGLLFQLEELGYTVEQM